MLLLILDFLKGILLLTVRKYQGSSGVHFAPRWNSMGGVEIEREGKGLDMSRKASNG